MKLSKTALKELTQQYRAVLRKCALPAALVMAFAASAPAFAVETPFLATDGQELSDTYENYENSAGDRGGVAAVDYGTTGVTVADNTEFKNNTTKVSAGGALKLLNGVSIGDNVLFQGNSASDSGWGGGAIYIKLANGDEESENPNVYIGENAVFDGNTATDLGGAIALEYGNLTIDSGATFINNIAGKKNGGAISMWQDANDRTEIYSTLTIDSGATFKNNKADKNGGAISIEQNAGSATIENSTLTNNIAETGSGGAIYNEDRLVVSNVTFDGNVSNDAADHTGGGAIFAKGVSKDNKADTTVSGSTFKNNKAISTNKQGGGIGGAIYSHHNSKLIVRDSLFEDNEANFGGAIYTRAPNGTNESTEMKITNSTFKNNTAMDIGAVGAFGKSTLNYLTFTGNKATAAGGGDAADPDAGDGAGALFFGSDSKSLLTDSTFTGNTSEADGGAIATRRYNKGNNVNAVLDILSSTFTQNESASFGGAIYNSFYNSTNASGSAYIGGSTFTENTAKQGGAIYNDGRNKTNTSDPDAKDSNGASLTIADSSFTGNTAEYGGAIYNTGILKIDDGVVFSKNTASSQAGAIYNLGDMTIGNNVVFDSNSADAIGALFNQKTLAIGDNVQFVNNKALADKNATTGAAQNQNGAVTIGKNALFENNSAASHGGGGYYQEIQADKTDDAVTTFDAGARFINNSSYGSAGAVYNYNANSLGKDSIIKFGENAIFQGNRSINSRGGAIGNFDGTINLASGAQFINNSAKTDGGAIFNSGTLTFNGDVTFAGNMANGVLNDIYNDDGTINFNGGTVTLDGGITTDKETKTGTVTFADDTSLVAKVLADASKTPIISANKLSGNINLIANSAGQIKFDAVDMDDFSVAFTSNLFDMTNIEGLYTIAKKSNDELAANTGATGNQVDMISGIISGPSANATFNSLQSQITSLLQSQDQDDVNQALAMVDEMAPTAAPITVANATTTANQILTAVGTRLSGGSISAVGQSSGDYAVGETAMWVQGLYNKSKLSGTDGFDAESKGIAAGLEYNVNDSVKIGAGYAFTTSEIEPTAHKSDVDSNTVMLYAEYKPSDWFLNAVASYTMSAYDTKNYVGATTLGSEYDVNSIAVQAMTGYDFGTKIATITPEAGLRYINVAQDAYTDTAGSKFDSNTSDVLTAVAGVKFKSVWNITDSFALKPELRIGATYDIVNDDVTSVMTMANGSVVTATGEALDPLAAEVGVGLMFNLTQSADFGLVYEGRFRKDYTDNTGMVMMKIYF